MSPRRACSVVLLGLGPFLPDLADAQQPPEAPCAADPAACGKKEFELGVAAYQKGDFTTALSHFRKALVYRQHPAVAFNLALAEGKTGLLLQAVARLDDILRDPQASNKLKANAARERDAFASAVGVVSLDSAVEDSGIRAMVDGSPLTGTPPSAKVNPGQRHVQVRVDGRLIVDREISVGPGERVRLAVTREREVAVVLPQRPKPVTPPPVPPPQRSRGIDPIWFYGSAGLTVVLGGLTTWSALDTRAAYSDYESALPALPQREIDERVSDGHAKEQRTNILLGGTALVAVGTAALGLFATEWDVGATEVSLSPRGVHLGGRF